MTDPELKEAAALLPLDLLDPAEERELEAALASRPALRQWTRGVHESTAALLMADCAPRHAPAGVLADIRRRTVQRGRPWSARRIIPWAGWAAAAVLAVLLLDQRQ